jgi:FlaG/FlaF family flagellin (archaellin)
VILAAVIAAFVFGMAGNISKTKIIAATASQQGNSIIVTYNGGQDAAQVSSMAAYINSSVSSVLPNVVGSSVKGDGGVGQDHVTVTATFNDGSQQVILDTFV